MMWVMKMIESCDYCVRKMKLVKFDYSKGGCVHTDYDGYACLAFAHEGVVVHMVGIENGTCEMYQPRKETK